MTESNLGTGHQVTKETTSSKEDSTPGFQQEQDKDKEVQR